MATANMRNIETEMRTVITSWKASGQTQQAFCISQGIPFNRFYYWYRKLAGKKSIKGFIQVKSQEEANVRMNIIYPSGVRIEMLSSPGVEDLLRLIKMK